jgi:RNA polymerase sigma-70 factor, ECF subfamily
MPEAVIASSTTDRSAVDAERQFEPYRRELTGYCYRMLGSASESEDAVQETMIRAWRAFDRFEGRSSVRSWLYRIATNVCLDMLGGAQRRARPMDLTERGTVDSPLQQRAEVTWIGPVPDASVLTNDPEQAAVNRESIKLAFIAMLQHLPPRQRAVLIMREVLCWRAEEVAALLETTVASVNSALQRARATLGGEHIDLTDPTPPADARDQALLDSYLDAFERYDMDSLRALLRDDATMSMPPYDLWLQGRDEIERWLLGPGAECRDSRLVPVAANGSLAYGQYRRQPDGSYTPWSLMVLETDDDGAVVGINSFLDTARLFPLFGLPPRHPDGAARAAGSTTSTE